MRPSSTLTLNLSTSELSKAVHPEQLADVLSSLKFRKVVRSYHLAGDVTTVIVDGLKSMALLSMLGTAASREE